MRYMTTVLLTCFAAGFAWSAQADGPSDPNEGFRVIFNGRDFTGWEGDREFWSVVDGAFRGVGTPDHPVKDSTWLIWRGGEPEDFELKVRFRMVGGNSGIQYRSEELDRKYVVSGYQADIAPLGVTGMLWYQGGGSRKGGGMGTFATDTHVTTDDERIVVGQVADKADLRKIPYFRENEWNEYHIICRGNAIVQKVNGYTTARVVDDYPKRRKKGIIALQLHGGEYGRDMRVEFKDVRLKLLDNRSDTTRGNRGTKARRWH